MAAYDITELQELEHDTLRSIDNSLVMIDSTHFILAYKGNGDIGVIATFSIDGSYNITEIDSLTYDASQGADNSLVMIDSTHFILAHRGVDNDGFIRTFSINGSYEITALQSLEHDTVSGGFNSLVKIDSTHFMLAYVGADDDGFIKTFSIDGSYNITEIDSLEHDPNSFVFYNSLIQIDATHYMLAFYGTSSSDGIVKTFSIDGSYNITEIDSLAHDAAGASFNSLAMVDSTHFILSYKQGGSNDGVIKTFSIDGSYDNITEIDNFIHDTNTSDYNSLVQIDATHFILAYAGSGEDGFIKTFSIDSSADNIAEIDSLEHDTLQGKFNSLVGIDSTHYILAYGGEADDGFIKTFVIESGVIINTTNFFQFIN